MCQPSDPSITRVDLINDKRRNFDLTINDGADESLISEGRYFYLVATGILLITAISFDCEVT